MTLGANQIAAYAADLLDTEEQIEALQGSKRDLYASIRDEHGKADALSLKRAVKLSRMDPEKREEAEAIDTEAQRMLDIIERAARAPRATRESAKSVPIPADEADDQSTAALTEALRIDRPVVEAVETPRREGDGPADEMSVIVGTGLRAAASPAGTQAPLADTPLSSEAQVREMRSEWPDRQAGRKWTYADKPHPDCLNTTQCGGFSNLGLCEPCRIAAAQGQVA